MKKAIGITAAVVAISLVATGCFEENQPTTTPSAQQQAAEVRQDNLNRLQASQPEQTMNYSPTRQTVNFWMETWDEPGKLSYVYFIGANGEPLGYYVLEGLPVSYCVGITQPYDVITMPTKGSDGRVVNGAIVPAPGMDGVYYGGCNDRAYYGKDAVSGSYVEWTVGMGINVLLFDQPLARQGFEPWGYTVIAEDGSLSEG